jgi:hypothetical protein
LPKRETRETHVTINEGEAALYALLLLRNVVEIFDSGVITATLGADIIHGQTTAGAIEWRDRSAMFRERECA